MSVKIRLFEKTNYVNLTKLFEAEGDVSTAVEQQEEQLSSQDLQDSSVLNSSVADSSTSGITSEQVNKYVSEANQLYINTLTLLKSLYEVKNVKETLTMYDVLKDSSVYKESVEIFGNAVNEFAKSDPNQVNDSLQKFVNVLLSLQKSIVAVAEKSKNQ